ncbi:MAG: glycosyltransferase 87 family protein [Gaiellaceae bacterium]
MAGLGAGLVTLALVAACTALAWPADSPLVPVAGGRLVGDAALAWAFLGCAAVALAAYAAGIVLLLRRGARVAAVLAVACAIQLAPLGAPLLLSSDAWTYWLYGRIAAVQGGNPYADPPAAYPADPAFRWAGEAWRDTTSVYAPGFTLASEPVALAAGSSPDAAAWAFKALAAGAMVAAALLAARVAQRRAFAAAFVGWNPVLALHFAGGGHNDAWMAALALGAIALAQSRRRHLAGVAWALAVLVKWVPLVFLPLRALEARRLGRRVGHLGLVPAGLAVLGVATWRYGTDWANVLDPLTRNAQLSTRFAIPSRLEQAGLPEGAAIGLVAGAFVLAYAWLLREAWRGRARLGLAGGLVLLAVPYLAPWYLAWAVPLAAVEDDPPAWLLAIGLSAYLLPQTVPI